MTEPALFSLENRRGSRPLDVVSWGAGVESSAYLTEILTNPTRHDADLQNLVVLHAVVGSEFTDTLTLSQRFILPLLADRGVRLVQLSRRGRHERDGIEMLDDSTTPKVMHHTGPWTLAQHNAANGFVLDRLILSEFTGRPYQHVIGYNRDETSRARNDLVFATQTRQPVHPLIEWDWSRQRCSQLLARKFGVTWPKSACRQFPVRYTCCATPRARVRVRSGGAVSRGGINRNEKGGLEVHTGPVEWTQSTVMTMRACDCGGIGLLGRRSGPRLQIPKVSDRCQ